MVAISLAVIINTQSVSASGLEGRGGPGNGSGSGQGSGQGNPGGGYALLPLSSEEAEALQEAILEEYSAYNLYQSVVSQYGDVYPFSLIAQSELQHVNALVRQAEKYGVAIPENPGLTSDVNFSTISEACAAGVAAEIADADLYDELKPAITHTDILRVFDNLKNASLENHLPAFQSCQ